MPTSLSILALLLLCISFPGHASVLDVGPGRPYATVQAAAIHARAGDTILVHGGTYPGGEYIENLKGSPAAWITVLAAPGETVIYRGGSEAFHFTDAAYIRLSNIIFEGQTGNGVNIDDGGTYDSPAHSIIIENCEWRAMNATGNNDQLKLSGVDTLTVRNCSFRNGSAGGSAVDMVGCHYAVFEQNTFTSAGSNSIQAKGGCQYIRIERNSFINGGERALNIGGSTGAPYFRPLNAPFEASHIHVGANVFTGSIAPIAFVGAVNCEVVNNTIYKPLKWAIRILQETVGSAYLPCGNNRFINNIVYLGNAAANPTVNIGSNTAPQTFQFSNNLWYNYQSPGWSGPNLPVTETGGILRTDPQLIDPENGNFSILPNSPATGKGSKSDSPVRDFLGALFNTPRSIGAIEGNPPQVPIDYTANPSTLRLALYPNPSRDGRFRLEVQGPDKAYRVVIFNSLGKTMFRHEIDSGNNWTSIPMISVFPPGTYHALVTGSTGTAVSTFVVLR